MRLVAVHKKFGTLLDNMLTQGASPHKVALAIALGGSIGILPVVWGSTVLCALLAYLLRLNQVGIQAANYLTFPLQIALFVPFTVSGQKFSRGANRYLPRLWEIISRRAGSGKFPSCWWRI
jgi:hypothetical protein